MTGRVKTITGYNIFLDQMLGKGAFGEVFVGESQKTKQKVAIKALQKKLIDSHQYYKGALISEIKLLEVIKSPHVVGFLDVMESANTYYIVQELCEGGELGKLIAKRGRLPEEEAIACLMHICTGFVELIKEGIMHRDLKPENILIHQNVLKIADFGFAKGVKHQGKDAHTTVGTPLYMSPEILRGSPYSVKCDIWSLGIIFYEMLTGKTPWSGSSEYQLLMNTESQPLTFPVPLSEITKHFIKKCLATSQNDRFSWNELLAHPIFKGHFENFAKQFEETYKTIMSHIRYEMRIRNNDLASIFPKSGTMNYQQFSSFLLGFSPQLVQKQIKHIFKKVNASGTQIITLQQLQHALQQFGTLTIPDKANNLIPTTQDQTLYNPPVSSVQKKVGNCFYKLLVVLKNTNGSLPKVFDNYRLTEKGTINVAEYGYLLTSLDNTFTSSEIDIAFSILDRHRVKNVDLKELSLYIETEAWEALKDHNNLMPSGKTQLPRPHSNSGKNHPQQGAIASFVPNNMFLNQGVYAGQQQKHARSHSRS